MKESIQNIELERQLNNLSNAEKKFRVRSLFTLITILTILLLLITLSLFQFRKYSTQVSQLKTTTKTLNDSISKLQHRLKNFEAFSEYSVKWDSVDILVSDPIKYKLSQEAHEALLALADSVTLNPESVYLRYYVKYKDQYPKYNRIPEVFKRNRVQNSIRRIGYKTFDIDNDSYRENIGTNVIHFHPEVSENDIKAIALCLLRVGIELKGIEVFSNRWINSKFKTVEIGSEKSLVNSKTLTAKDVLNLDIAAKIKTANIQ